MPKPKIPEVKEQAGIPLEALPFAEIARKLEMVWQPDGDTFLAPGSVGKTALKAGAITAAAIQTYIPAWVPVSTYATGWSDYDAATGVRGWYWKDPTGLVRLRGIVKKSSAAASGETMFTLPAGYRPGGAWNRAFPALVSLLAGAIRITPAGTVDVATIPAGAASPPEVRLEGITFYAEQ